MTPKQILIAIFLGLVPFLVLLGMGQLGAHCLNQELTKAAPTLISAGSIIVSVGRIWLIIQAFKQSAGWGAAVIFLPLADGFFSQKFWDVAKVPFFISLIGYLLFGLTMFGNSSNHDGQKLDWTNQDSSDTKLELRQKRTGTHPTFKLDTK